MTEKRCGTCQLFARFYSLPDLGVCGWDSPVPQWLTEPAVSPNEGVSEKFGTECQTWEPKEPTP